MRRMDLSEVMTVTNIAIITDEENKGMYHTGSLVMYRGEMQEKVLHTVMKLNVKAKKEEQVEAADKFVSLLEELNLAFNRSVGAPESMRLFKVLDMKSRYTGNETVAVELELATLATGAGSSMYTLLGFNSMTINIWGTEANVASMTSEPASETYGLGNALRSWKSVMKKYGRDFTPAILVNYVQ